MPRDGSGVYNIPSGTYGVEDTSIESARYNTFVDDVAHDLNFPRPIVAGGTGATNAAAALAAISGETAKQVIANYDMDPLLPGSFYSAATATSAPVAGHAFSGIAYQTDNNNMFVEARDQDDTTSPGRVYTRQKKAGVWSSWKIDYITIIGAARGVSDSVADMFYGLYGTAPNSAFIVNPKADMSGTTAFSVTKAGDGAITGGWSVGGSITAGGSVAVTGGLSGAGVSLAYQATAPAAPAAGSATIYFDANANLVLKRSDGSVAYLGVPPGTVAWTASTSADVGWALCNGGTVPKATNPMLWARLGNQYGGDANNVGLPDIRGRVIAHVDGGAGRLTAGSQGSGTFYGFGTAAVLSAVGGLEYHALTINEVPAHAHTATIAESPHSHTSSLTSSSGPSFSQVAQFHTTDTNNIPYTIGTSSVSTGVRVKRSDGTLDATENAGASWLHSNVQPTIILNAQIKLG